MYFMLISSLTERRKSQHTNPFETLKSFKLKSIYGEYTFTIS